MGSLLLLLCSTARRMKNLSVEFPLRSFYPMSMGLRSLIVFGLSFFVSAAASALCVNVEKANLRYGPSTKHTKTWEVYRYMPFQKLKSQSGWHRVKDVDGDIHWIFARLVTDKFKCAVVKTKKANLRTGPSTKHSKVPWGPAEKYYAFRVLKKQGDWVHVQDAAGGKAWIFGKLVWVQ